MTFLGRNHKKTGNTEIAQFFCHFLLYLHGLRFKETTQFVGYTAIFYKGLHVDIKCDFTVREIMKIHKGQMAFIAR